MINMMTMLFRDRVEARLKLLKKWRDEAEAKGRDLEQEFCITSRIMELDVLLDEDWEEYG